MDYVWFNDIVSQKCRLLTDGTGNGGQANSN